jgi:SAM-dependent methyltransferase
MNDRSEFDCNLSAYVQRCVPRLGAKTGSALDLACGAGRHSNYLARCGYKTIAADLDIKRLARFDWQGDGGSGIHRLRVDATKPLPFRTGSFDLVVIVHFVCPGLIAGVTPILRSGGHLLIETYAGHGENWRTLPAPGEYRDELGSRFEILDYYERPVGPTKAEAAVVRLFARLK